MTDLKAAAKRLREIVDGSWSGRESRDACILAAQAIEAWAWQQETGAVVKEMGSGGFFCAVYKLDKTHNCFMTNNYYADTPLGAVLAAMEGERDGQV